jgi:hypothetical protein
MSDAMAREFGRHRATIQGVRGVWKQHMQASADMDLLKDRVDEFSKALGRAPRILVAKLGQDGHDRGQKVIASAFADLGLMLLPARYSRRLTRCMTLPSAMMLTRLVFQRLPRRI